MSKEKTIKTRQNKLRSMFLEQLKKTPTIEQSAQKVGVSRMTILRWRKASKSFDRNVEESLREGREFVSDIAETQMFSQISQGEPSMIKYFLSHNNARYRDKLELSGKVDTKNDPLTKEQKSAIRQALKLSSLRKHEKKNQKK
jgi:hypothetical protein